MAKEAPAGRGAGPEGRIVRAGGKDGPQVVASKGKRWTDKAEEIFLDCLAASCNVTWSARQTGFSREAIYRRRRLDPGFRARWDAALDQGVARIDMLLVRNAEAYLEGRPPDPDTPIPVMSVQDAIAILKLHRASTAGAEGKRPGWLGRPRTLDEMRDSILTKFSAIERHRGKA